jgi:hypothetical protein
MMIAGTEAIHPLRGDAFGAARKPQHSRRLLRPPLWLVTVTVLVTLLTTTVL